MKFVTVPLATPLAFLTNSTSSDLKPSSTDMMTTDPAGVRDREAPEDDVTRVLEEASRAV